VARSATTLAAAHGSLRLTSGLFLNLFAASLNVLSEALHRVATRDRAQQAQQHQYRQDSLKHDVSPSQVFNANSRAT
jgi:hypothetical protein